MSKLKISFSLILTIFLVGILSTAAFAKDPYGLKPVQSGMDLIVNYTGNTDAGDNASTTFDLKLYNPDGSLKDTYPNLPVTLKVVNGSNTYPGSYTISSGLTVGTVYTVKLYYAGQATVLSTSTALIEDTHNGSLLNIAGGAKTNADGEEITVDKDGNGMHNANLTGYNNTRKNRSGQKVHGFYQNNTNSCASCHQTHTASDSRDTSENALLFKDGVYSTCSACHDGTTGAYNNAWAPADAETVSSISGTFNVKEAGHNGSLHEADGSLNVSAAPGGNRAGGKFNQEFDCASCHAAHGSGSKGENNLSMDPLGWGSVEYKPLPTTPTSSDYDNLNGKLFKNLAIKDKGSFVTTAFDKPFVLVKSQVSTPSDNLFYNRAGVTTGSWVIQTYRWTGTSNGYKPDYSLWLREKGYPYKADTKLQNTTGDDINASLSVVWRDGFAWGDQAAVDAVAKAQLSLGIDVETTGNIEDLYEASATYIPNSGIEMSKYCASCHIDYLSQTRKDDTGTYTSAHRHQTASDELTCVRCHFGHGTEATIMKDANDSTYFSGTHAGDLSYFLDPNPSSALKRYTGMAVCYACHGGGSQFLGNQNNGTDPKTNAVTEKLKSGQPGTTTRGIY